MWSDVKDHIRSMPGWKRSLWIILIITGATFIPLLIAWIFTLHGAEGLLTVNGVLRNIVIVLVGLPVALLLLSLLDLYLASRKKPEKVCIPAAYIWTLAAVLSLIPLCLFGWIAPLQVYRSGDKPVQLLMADGTGRYGIPDMAVTFWTREPSANSLKWGKSGLSNVLKEDKPSRQHAFMLTGLQPDRSYGYSLNDGTAVAFYTPPLKTRPLHFAAGGDCHFGAPFSRNDLTRKMLEQIALPEHGYQQFFFLGDMVEHGYNDAMWQEALQAFTPVTARIPTRPVGGNHDLLFNGVELYREYCYPQPMTLQTGTRLWQRIDNGNIHFLLLDLEWSAEAYTPAEAAWLEKQLASIPAGDWCIVMSHCFYYSSGGYLGLWSWYDDQDTISRLTPLFEKYDVDLVLSGHNHLNELLQKNGVTYAISGAFGGLPNPPRDYISPASVWYLAGQHAFLDVTVNDDAIDLVYRDPGYNGLKSFRINK